MLPPLPLKISQKYKSAIDQTIRHLVFTNNNTRYEFNYSDFYGEGVEWKSLSSMTMLSNILKDKNHRYTCFQSFTEGLHIMLKKACSLEPQLLIDLCKNIKLTNESSNIVAACKNLTASLIHWIHCLTIIHDELLPYSRILFQSEAELGRSMNLAETLVMLKDQQVLRSRANTIDHLQFLEWLSGKEVSS